MKTYYVLNIFIDFWRRKKKVKLSLQKAFLLMLLSNIIWLLILTSNFVHRHFCVCKSTFNECSLCAKHTYVQSREMLLI